MWPHPFVAGRPLRVDPGGAALRTLTKGGGGIEEKEWPSQ
jgi:hypothetical protein